MEEEQDFWVVGEGTKILRGFGVEGGVDFVGNKRPNEVVAKFLRF